MRTCMRGAVISICIALFSLFSFPLPAAAQAGATSGTVTGTVTDPTGAVVRGANVTIQNPSASTSARYRRTAWGTSSSPTCPTTAIT